MRQSLLPLGGMKRKRPPPSEYLWGLSAGFKLRIRTSVRGMGYSLAYAGCFDTSQDKKYSNTALLSVRVSRFCIAWIYPRIYPCKNWMQPDKRGRRETLLTQKKKGYQCVLHIDILHCTFFWRPQGDLNPCRRRESRFTCAYRHYISMSYSTLRGIKCHQNSLCL